MAETDRRAGFHLEGHAPRLQSLRGIAALSVALGHAFTVMVHGRIEDSHFTLRPTNAFLAVGEVLIQPNTAVILFYVLSGFVLGEALRRNDPLGSPSYFMAFVIRRLWRLLPAMWVSIGFAAIVVVAFRHPPFPGATGWFNASLSLPVTIDRIILSLLGLTNSINGVLWSVQIELAMIPILPLAVWLSRRTSVRADLLIVASLCVITTNFWDLLPNFVLYSYCFYLGVCLPKLITDPAWAAVLGNSWGVSIATAALVPIDFLYDSLRLWIVYKFIMDALVCTYIIGFVMLRSDCRPVRLLDRRWLVWLGDVSYSFYVFAMSVLIVSASVLLELVPDAWVGSDLAATAVTIAAGLICVAISLALAQLSYAWIEKPCTLIGRQWAKRIELGGWPAAHSTGAHWAAWANFNGPLATKKVPEVQVGDGYIERDRKGLSP
jgi:peptidoglycan/LPS O-acetylase OafA/YrhL